MITKVSSLLFSARRLPAARRLLHHSSIPGVTAATAANSAAAPSPTWSGSLNYATPEADFRSLHASANPAQDAQAQQEAERMLHQLHSSSPESAIGFTHVTETMNNATKDGFTSLLQKEDLPRAISVAEGEETRLSQDEWDRMLYQLQASSPESAIGFTHVAETMNNATKDGFTSLLQKEGLPTAMSVAEGEETRLSQEEWDRIMYQLQVSSPESALGFTHVAETLDGPAQQNLQSLFAGQEIPSALPETPSLNQETIDVMTQQMLLVSPESATGYTHVAECMTADERHDFAAALAADQNTSSLPLPTTYREAMADQHERAIVITTAVPPFRVVNVNDVWEGLCGFTQSEVQNQPIGKFLRGPETQVEATLKMVNELETNPTKNHSVHLINYTKTGRKFHNHLQVGPLFSTTGTPGDSSEQKMKVEYLVGVLEEVAVADQGDEGMQMAA